MRYVFLFFLVGLLPGPVALSLGLQFSLVGEVAHGAPLPRLALGYGVLWLLSAVLLVIEVLYDGYARKRKLQKALRRRKLRSGAAA